MNNWLIFLIVVHLFAAFHGTYHNSFGHKRYFGMLTSFILYLMFGSLVLVLALIGWAGYMLNRYPNEMNDTSRHKVIVRTHLFDFYEQNGVNIFLIEADTPTPGDVVEVVESAAGGKNARSILFTIRDVLDNDYTRSEVLGLDLEQAKFSGRYLVVCDKQHII